MLFMKKNTNHTYAIFDFLSFRAPLVDIQETKDRPYAQTNGPRSVSALAN
jgi:hypothetical protein